MTTDHGPKTTEKENVLATVHFVMSTLVNNEESQRYYKREVWLTEKKASREHLCSGCRVLIMVGEFYAVGVYTRYCHRCYAPMTEDEAWLHSDEPKADAATVARLLGLKVGLTSGREIRHVVHEPTVTKE